MEEFNHLVVELNDLYKKFQENKNKKTSASVRKVLMKIKTKSHTKILSWIKFLGFFQSKSTTELLLYVRI